MDETSWLMKELNAILPQSDDSPEKLLSTLVDEIRARFPENGKIIMMPAGRFAKELGRILEGEGFRIIAWMDNFKNEEQETENRPPVIRPESFPDLDFDKVLIATPYVVAQQDMKDQLTGIQPERQPDVHMLFDILGSAFERVITSSVESFQDRAGQAEIGKRLCITTPFLHHNYMKLMKYLKGEGYYVVVITGNRYLNGTVDIESFEGKGYFDVCHIAYPYDVIMPRLVQQLDVDIVHAIVTSASGIALARALEAGPGCFISDYCDFKEILYDSDEGFLSEMTLQQYNREKKAWQTLFTQSDGVIIKDAPEIIHELTKKYGRTPRWMQFMSYPSLDFAEGGTGVKKLSELDGRIHVVYAGCVINNPNSHAYAHHKSLLTIARELNDGGIGFTIYNALDDGCGDFEEYRALSEKLPLFSYSGVVPQDCLAVELAKHDVGWFAFDLTHARESRFFLSTTFGSKIFNYMEAGLPVLVSEECHAMVRYVESKNIGKRIRIDGKTPLAGQIESVDIRALSLHVKDCIKELSMEKQIRKLTEFYEACLKTL